MLIDYTHRERSSRQIELPEIISSLAGKKNLKLVVLAGNFGARYEGTHHNLAYSFGQHLLTRLPLKTARDAQRMNGQKIKQELEFDDGSRELVEADVVTEAGSFRTGSGEVYLLEGEINQATFLIVKKFGDYNEIGDFAVPIAERLGIASRDIILVHDDLDLNYGYVKIEQRDPSMPSGNNAVFSLTRSLAYRSFERVADAILGSKFYKSLPADDVILINGSLNQLRSHIFELASIRSKDHLGKPQAIHNAIKNSHGLLNPINGFMKRELEPLVKKQIQAELEKAGLGNHAETKRELGTKFEGDERKAKIAELTRQIKEVSAPVEDTYTELKTILASTVRNELSFYRLTFGTQPVNRQETQIDYVLSPFDPQVFDQSKFDWAMNLLVGQQK